MLKNECLCIPRRDIYLYKLIANYEKKQPSILVFTIPKVKKRFEPFWKEALKNVPTTNPWIDNLLGTRKNKILKDERYPCTTSIMMDVDNLRFPGIRDFVQCRKTRLGSAGTCVDVSEPVVALRITNPRQKTRKCRYVPTIEWRVVGCSWLPDGLRKVKAYERPHH